MTNPIRIDLRDLTAAHLEACKPFIGQCRYTAPCIIGTLFDASLLSGNADEWSVDVLVEKGILAMPAGQVELATDLQGAFDASDWEGVTMLAQRIEAGTDEIPQEARPVGREPDPQGCAQ